MSWVSLIVAFSAIFHVYCMRARRRAGIQEVPIPLKLRLLLVGIISMLLLIMMACSILIFHHHGIPVPGFMWGGLLASTAFVLAAGYGAMRRSNPA
jgi:hypothetical protein